MPYISVRTNKTVSPAQEEVLTREAGRLISLLPGKSEQWLMADFTGDCHLHFQGKCDEGIAFISVRVYGDASEKDKNSLTAALTKLVSSTLSISAAHVYVQYESCTTWGWNGSNF